MTTTRRPALRAVPDVAPQAPKPARRRAPSAAKSLRPSVAVLQRRMGYGFGALAFSLTALSLSHLAEGVSLVAHRAAWEGWSVAGAIDLGFIAAEVMPFCVSAECAADTRNVRRSFAAVVLCASAAFNALAFSEAATSPVMVGAAVALGIAVPLAIATFTHFASRCLIGRTR